MVLKSKKPNFKVKVVLELIKNREDQMTNTTRDMNTIKKVKHQSKTTTTVMLSTKKKLIVRKKKIVKEKLIEKNSRKRKNSMT